LTSSSFIFTGSGGICFMISGASFILQIFCMGIRIQSMAVEIGQNKILF
jgi:hypothetical protein